LRAADLALLGAALALSACQSVAPQARPVDARDPRWRALVLDWNEQARERESLRGRAELAVDSDASGLHLRSRQSFALERPERLRVEVKGFLDQTLVLICIDRGSYQLFRAEGRRVETGAVHEKLLFEQAMIDLSPSELIELLLGAPLLDPTLRVAAAWQLAAGAVRLELVDDRGVRREVAEFAPEGQLAALSLFDERGRPERELRFAELREVGAARLPHRIELESSAPESRAEIVLRDLELDPALPEGLFRLPESIAPRGAAP